MVLLLGASWRSCRFSTYQNQHQHERGIGIPLAFGPMGASRRVARRKQQREGQGYRRVGGTGWDRDRQEKGPVCEGKHNRNNNNGDVGFLAAEALLPPVGTT
ncbi:unnamed protein product [Ectocarpus sp. CCAP 1310/34]|nr:unnamed protein product [Ectocarpus sp. CCAP 1310/34]